MRDELSRKKKSFRIELRLAKLICRINPPFLGTFWKILTLPLRFFGVRSPSKTEYFSSKGAFRKVLMLVSEK